MSTQKYKKTSGEHEVPPQHGAMASITMATSVPQAQTNSPAPKELGRARGICFTVYDYDSIIAKLRKEAQSATYAVLGFEVCPDTGRRHIQGFVYYANPRSLGKFSKEFGNCHVEIPRGTPKQNREYCLKLPPKWGPPNEKFEEFGTLPVQGHRADWDKAVRDIKSGVSVEDVILEQSHLLPAQRALREFKSMLFKPKNRDVNVIVLYGKGGTGKTRWAYDEYPDLYSKPVGNWWDGYSGQKTVLLDDYYGYIKYHELLTILDRYPLNLPYKGGYVWAQYDTVVITSNKHPDKWYHTGMTWPLRRRLKKIILVESIDGKTSYTEEDYPASEEAWRNAQDEAYAIA